MAEALPAFVAALHESPADASLWLLAAHTALDLQRYPLASAFYETAFARAPTSFPAVDGLWYSRFRIGNYEGAAQACRRARELDPANPRITAMLGQLAYMLGDGDAGRSMHARAISLDPDSAELETAFARLVQGDYETGWKQFPPGAPAQRARAELGGWTPAPEQVWKGESTKDRTVCIYRGGGHGDLFLFARYVPLLARRVAKVVMIADPEHDRLLRSLEGLAETVRHPDDVPEALFVYLWSLPGIFGTRVGSIPGRAPYLSPPPAGPPLLPARGMRVGLAWAGHPNTSFNLDRSVPSAGLLQPLLEIPGTSWVSMQVGYRSEEAVDLDFAERPSLSDWGDTAFVLSQLDLLVTVDTAVANLAGALGTPAWVLPPTYPEFRWGVRGERTPWYPGVRLFRRAHTREWPGVIARVAAAIAGVAAPR